MKFFKKLFGKKEETESIDLKEIQQQLAERTRHLKKPAIRLEKTQRVRKSKFGGKPVAGSGFEWPMSNGKPMAFLAQIDLSEMSSAYSCDWLSKEGLLLFFYDLNEMAWGFDPKDRGKWCVLYQPHADTVMDYPESLEDGYKITESYISAKRVEVLPHYEDPSIEALELSDVEVDTYIDFKAEEDEYPHHQIGGLPTPIQGNYMDLEAQLASNGVYVGGPDGYESDEAKRLEGGAKDWRLLFQFDSDDELDIMWGDCGMIYFWIQEDKAKRNQFDNTWLILQCS